MSNDCHLTWPPPGLSVDTVTTCDSVLRAPGGSSVSSVSMGTQTDPHWVLVPASSLDHLETQIKTVKENLIRKQQELMKVGNFAILDVR